MVLSQKVILFLQALVVIGLPIILWRYLQLHRFFPLAIVQIFAGIALGPSIFGAIAPDAFEFLFRREVLAGVDTLANIALVMFVFLAGCEADRNIISKSAGMVMKIGITGVLTPWILGGVAAFLISTYAPVPKVLGPIGMENHVLYAVAFGLAMSVTALPVLVILLRELGFNTKPIGSIALAVGGIDDAILWLSLPVLLPFAQGANFWNALAFAAFGGVATVLLVKYVVTPFLDKLLKEDAPERFLMSAVILVLFLSAAITEVTGLHAVLGAFIAGLMIPDKLRHLAQDKFDVPVALLLLPFFFLSTGLKTSFAFGDPTIWLIVTIAMVVCVGGKVLGVTIPALLSGQSVGFALTLGALMQCKGLMEIVVVTILFQKGIIGETTFSALVLTALISTAITAPLARAAYQRFGESATRTTGEQFAETTVEAADVHGATHAFGVLDFGGGRGRIAILKGDVVIGRHSNDDIRVNNVAVSRHHARMTALPNGRFEIRNQTAVRSEPNPMLVNGQAKETAIVGPGDTVSLGGIDFRIAKA